jgi:wyosine [tRNA(Phe)-imidazoG37] synthetase (radical SAM superfamily)
MAMRVYGPVPSRRFGLSLGIDVVPHKTCTLDCGYCQIGPTTRLIAEPALFYPVDEILADVEEALEDDPPLEVITLAGSGEPTLYSGLGALIDGLKARAPGVPLLLITNGTLLWREDVAAAAMRVDILAPSLDAGDPATFARVGAPHPELTFERVLDGLERCTRAFAGEVRLEIMLVAGVNDSGESLAAIAACLPRLRFDRIDLNTPVRPPVPERGALPCDEETLARAMTAFGPEAQPIGRFTGSRAAADPRRGFDDSDKDVRELLLRRPCTAEDLASSLGLHRHQVAKILEHLMTGGLVESRASNGVAWFHARGGNPARS